MSLLWHFILFCIKKPRHIYLYIYIEAGSGIVHLISSQCLQADIWGIECLPSIIFIWLTLLNYLRLKNPCKNRKPILFACQLSWWMITVMYLYSPLTVWMKERSSGCKGIMRFGHVKLKAVWIGHIRKTFALIFHSNHSTCVYLETVVQVLWLLSHPWSIDCHRGRGWWFLPGFQCNSAQQPLQDPGYWCQCFHGQEMFSLHSEKNTTY